MNHVKYSQKISAIIAIPLVVLYLIVCTLNFSPSVFGETKTDVASTGLIAKVGFEPLNPHLVLLGDGTRIYCTSFGNYTMNKDYANRMSFSYRDGTQLIIESLFWVNSTYGGKPLSLSKLPKADITVLVANDTVFEFRHPLKSDGGDIVGYLTVTYHFSKDVRPKISIVYENQLLSGWQITWCLLPSMTYLKTTETHAEMLSATTTVSFGAKTSVELGDNVNPQNWRLWSLTTWEDYGVAIVYGGLEKVLGGKGLTVVFPINETVVDPSQVAYVYYGSVSSSFQRRNFWANGYYRQFYVDETTYNFEYKGSSDGVTWDNLTVIAGDVADEFIFYDYTNTWLENDTFVHLVFVDYNSSAPLDQRYTVSYQTATLGVGSISLGTRQTVCTLVSERKKPTVSLDSNGYPWVGYTIVNVSGYDSYCVRKAAAKGGSSWGSETQLFTSTYTTFHMSAGVVVPLVSGKIYVCWEDSHPYEPALGRLYNGTGWEASKTIRPAFDAGGNAKSQNRFSVVVKSNYDIVFYYDQLASLTNNGTHVYTYAYASDSWGYTKWVSTQGMVGSVTINKTNSDMWFFYTRTHTGSYLVGDGIYYKKYTNLTGIWGSEVTVNSTILSLCDLHGFYEQSGGHLGVAYVASNYLYFISVDILADVYVFSNLTVTPMNCGFGATLTFSGQLFYQGTTIPPPDGDYNVQVLLSGLSVGSNHTLIEGNWSVSASAPNSNGTYVYTCTASNTPTPGTFSDVTVSDTAPPTFGIFSYNSTVAGTSCLFSGLANDDVNVSGYVFESNITGTVQNTTWTGFSTFFNATAAYCETVQVLPSGNGTVPSRFYANDTNDNWAASQIQTLNYSSTATYCIVVFHVSAGGSLYVNGAVAADSSSFNYSSGVQLSLAAVPNIGYNFAGFLWTNGSSATSPVAYTVLENDTVWTYFSVVIVPWPGPGPSPSPIQVTITAHVSASPGQATIFDLTVTWQTGISNLTVTSIVPGGSFSNWITLVDELPKTGGSGSMTISLKCTPSWDANLGQTVIPVSVGVQPIGGSASSASGTVYVTVVSAQQMGDIPYYLTAAFLAVAIIVGLIGYVRRLLHH